jgi:hypothetical protein
MLLPVIWSLAIASSFVLFVVDCSESVESVVCGDLVVVFDEYSTLSEVPIVVSDSVVCSMVVGTSQSISKTCEG